MLSRGIMARVSFGDECLAFNHPGPELQPLDSDFVTRVHESFGRQAFMRTLGAHLLRVDVGEVEIGLPFRAELCQQDEFLHAGVVTTIVDNACGYAAYTLMPAGFRVLTVEFKLNLLAPAVGAHFRALGRVTKAGRQITVCTGDVFAARDGKEKLIATMLATVMTLSPLDLQGKSREIQEGT